MPNSIIVDDPLQQGARKEEKPEPVNLTDWVVMKVNDWEEARNTNYVRRWNEYYRLWRGIWNESDKTRNVERSRIIAPALQQAIEASVAEMEESIFHRKRWFDLDQDVMQIREAQNNAQGAEGQINNQPPGLQDVVDTLLEDFRRSEIPQSIAEILLNGALYGTGIGKLLVSSEEERVPEIDGFGNVTSFETQQRIKVSLAAVDPREFVIDTAARTIKDALGIAHIYRVPLHEVLKKQDKGVYRKGFVGLHDNSMNKTQYPTVDAKPKDPLEVEITEYHGLVPKRLFEEANKENPSPDTLDAILQASNEFEGQVDDSADLVEVIVWIANRTTLLKVVRNPFVFQDRSFIAFQYETVPNRFWGRGVAEKGYNPQKALDAELRARIDSLALSTYPMLLINGLMAPRNQDYQVRPGRNVVVSGNVGEAVAPFKFPPPDAQSYRQTAEFERMVTVATGALDSAAPLGVNPRNETASGISMIMSSVLKRSKRNLRNIENQFLNPLINKAAWRYMQFDNERYPVKDYKFRVIGALGAQAREFEVAQLTQLLQTQDPQSPGYWLILKGVLKNYNMEDKEALMAIIDQFLQRSINPPPPPPDPEIELKKQEQARKDEELKFKIDQAVEEALRKDDEVEAEAARDRGESIWNSSEAVLNARKAQVEAVNALSKLITALKSSGEGGGDVQEAVRQADRILNREISEAKQEPELQGLRTSIRRQEQEESEPGTSAKQGDL